jgi:hypothetical protein
VSDKEAELRRQVAEGRKQFEELVKQVKARCLQLTARARERVAYAAEQERIWRERLGMLAPYADHPEGKLHHANAHWAVQLYAAMQKMLAEEIAVHQANAEVANKAVPAAGAPPFRNPDDVPAFLEAHARMDAAAAAFLWRANEAGIDAVLRATNGAPTREPLDAAEGIRRATTAQALREDAADDLAFGRLLEELGRELAAACALVTWGERAYDQGLSDDPRWQQLDGVVALLDGVYARVATYPRLARLFPKPERAVLPFDRATAARDRAVIAKGPEKLELKQGRASALKLDGMR